MDQNTLIPTEEISQDENKNEFSTLRGKQPNWVDGLFCLCARVLYSRAKLEKRSILIGQAFDDALLHALKSKAVVTNNANPDLALLAVQLNDLHCGPLSRHAEDFLHKKGIYGIRFTSLRGHYVLRDMVTGLFHDVETYAGAASPEELAIAKRVAAITGDVENGDRIRQGFAQMWKEQRKQFYAR